MHILKIVICSISVTILFRTFFIPVYIVTLVSMMRSNFSVGYRFLSDTVTYNVRFSIVALVFYIRMRQIYVFTVPIEIIAN